MARRMTVPGHPTGGWRWWCGVLVAITPFVAAFLVARMAAPAARRVLPLAALLNMTRHGPGRKAGPMGVGHSRLRLDGSGFSDLRYRLWPFRHD